MHFNSQFKQQLIKVKFLSKKALLAIPDSLLNMIGLALGAYLLRFMRKHFKRLALPLAGSIVAAIAGHHTAEIFPLLSAKLPQVFMLAISILYFTYAPKRIFN
jgi:hypothetical protein